jgi:hypothetical protein
MFLDAITKSITAVLAEAVASADLVVTASYEDLTSTTFLAGGSDGTTTGTTAATIVAAPAASTQRRVREISLYNADTTLHTVTVALLDNGTIRPIYAAPVSPGSTLYYSNGVWSTIPYRSISRAGVKTQVNQLDVGGAYQESLVGPFNPMPTSDINTQEAQSPDQPFFTSIVGDPSGDFAGVNILEKLVDDSGDLAMAVKVKNPPLLDANGATVSSDAPAPIIFRGQSGAIFIFDTTGYQSFSVSTSAGLTASVASSNDGITFGALQGAQVGAGAANAPITSLSSSSLFLFPAVGRYTRLTFSAAGVATVYLRTQPAPIYAGHNPVNITQIGSTNLLSAGVSGVMPVAGPTANAIAPTANPNLIAGIDSGTPGTLLGAALTRRLLTDNTGRLRLAEEAVTTNSQNVPSLATQEVGQFEGQSLLELLAQMLLELRINNQLMAELPSKFYAALQSLQLSPTQQNQFTGFASDEPAAYRSDPTIFN